MWLRAILVIVFLWILIKTVNVSRDVYEPVSDAQAFRNIKDNVDTSLQPVEVIQRQDDKMRVMFLDTDTYAGKLMDFDVSTKQPTLVNPKLTSDILPLKKTL